MLKKYFYTYGIPFIYLIGGILDATTDLFTQLLDDLGVQPWIKTLFRIIMISIGIIKTSKILKNK